MPKRIFEKLKNKKNGENHFIKHSNNSDKIIVAPARRIHSSVFENTHQTFKPIFSWIAPEFHQPEKSSNWWLSYAVIYILVLMLEWFYASWTMILATSVFAVVYFYINEYHPAKHTRISISDFGIKIGHKEIPFSHIESFWILYDSKRIKTLNFRQKKSFFVDVSLELEEQDPTEIRAFLLRNLPEWEGKNESLSDIIIRTFNL